MKKIGVLFLSALFFISCFTFISNAESERIFENDPIFIPKVTPTIDGVINSDEGWSDAAWLNEDTAGYFYMFNPLSSTVDFYFAYSDEGLYFAANYVEGYGAYTVRFYDEFGETQYHRSYIDANSSSYDYTNYPEFTPDGTRIDSALIPPKYDYIYPDGGRNAFWIGHSGNTVEYSTDVDYLNNDYGWNGDVVSLSIDPLGVFNATGLFGNSDYTIQYNVGIFEGDIVKVALSRDGNSDITDLCKAKGSLNNKSMTFEIMIPWEKIVYDANDLGEIMGVTHVLSVDEVIAAGATHRASVTLMDRFKDPDSGMIDTWGKFVTVCDRCDDGLSGSVVGPPLKALGLKLIMSEHSFADVEKSAWYYDAALWCANKGYMSGTSDTQFSPDSFLTRAQFVQILAKISKADLDSYKEVSSFNDVPVGKWYSAAVEWAYKNGYTGGKGYGMFVPQGLVVRQELASFLRTFAEKNGIKVSSKAIISVYDDYARIATWARDAMGWAVKAGLISGTGSNTLSPTKPATRAQVSQIIKNYCEKFVK